MSKVYYDSTRNKAIRLVNLEAYKEKHPGNRVFETKIPSMATLNKWAENGVSKTPCKCKVDQDGHCPHGVSSWLLILGLI